MATLPELLREYEPVTANPRLMRQGEKSRNKPAFEMKTPTRQDLLDNAALATAPIPIVGDVLGLGADAHRFATDPESRTWGNAGLAALGLLPFVPPLMSAGLGKLAKARGVDITPPSMTGPGKNEAGAIVYHGSPHKFDQFDSSKIGTGEGAQAYGHGLYLAENPAVAKEYSKLTPAGGPQPAPRRFFNGNELDAGSPEYHAATLLSGGKSVASVRKEVQGWINGAKDWPPQRLADPNEQKMLAGWQKTLDMLNQVQSKSQFKTLDATGSLYKVDLPDEHIAKMIAWDKPINEQSPEVLRLLEKAGINTESTALAGPMVMGQERHLAKHGIPGVRYLDEGSREAGKGTSNFVVFPGNENLLTILESGGSPVTKALREGKPAKAPTEFEIRHQVAQKNAALPVEQGGLGLPPDNTPRQRAEAMGYDFDDPKYHGSVFDIKEFSPQKASTESYAGSGTYTTTSPEDASINYASIYGPDVEGKVQRGLEDIANNNDKDFRRIGSRLRDGALTPRQQEIVLGATIDADNAGAVYPLVTRSEKAIDLDARSGQNPSYPATQKYNEVDDIYEDTPAAEKWMGAVRGYESQGGDASRLFDLDPTEANDLGDIYRAAQKGGDSMYDEFTGDIISSGVGAGDLVRELGVDPISHTPMFRNPQLNIADKHTISLEPENIRSIFAAFDPLTKNSKDILAGLGAAGIGTGAMLQSDDAEATTLSRLLRDYEQQPATQP
jgi:hypothetical protein